MKRKKRDSGGIDYWQSNTDLMSGLVLILLLIIMLLVLYLMRIPDYDQPDPETGDSFNVDDMLGDVVEETYTDTDLVDDEEGDDDEEGGGWYSGGETERDDDDGGGGGGDDSIGTDPEYKFEYPLPTHSGEDWSKAAVYATVVDQETGRAIRRQGITFELYEEQVCGIGGVLRFLNTYYPVKIEYRNYETTEEGVFYLPEKVEEGFYYFKQITELEGYDMAEPVHFDVDDIYDWPDPYVVSIELSPSKNYIPITLEDRETHEPLSDGTIEVHAAEDIITADNTLRYAKDTTADTVLFDEEGYGQSKELYLGLYTLVQGTIPRYYAGIDYTQDVQVRKKDGSTPETIRLLYDKTRISLQLTDNLYPNQKLEGAEFSLTCKSHPELSQTGVTDANGELVFTDLEKNSLYTLKQLSAPEPYRFLDEEIEIYVSEDGRIEGEAAMSSELTNYIVRLAVSARDIMFGKPVSDVNMALYDSTDREIGVWTTSGTEKIFENLPTGSYYVLVNGNKDKRYEFELKDEAALQEIHAEILTLQDILAAVAGIGILLLFMIGVILILKKRKQSKQKMRKEKSREK